MRALEVLGVEGFPEIRPGDDLALMISGAVARDLRPGDVLAIPSGVPHQFVDVSEPFLYFVAKVDAS